MGFAKVQHTLIRMPRGGLTQYPDIGVRCVGAPIRDYTRRIIGAVSLSGPSMRFTDERLDKELIPLVKKAADEISMKLGFHR